MKENTTIISKDSFVLWCSTVIIVLFSSIVIIGYALDTTNILNFPRLSIAIAIVFISLLVYYVKVKKPKFERHEVISSILIFIAFFIIGMEPILFSLYPVNQSVDFVHHFALLDYIYDHQSLVQEAQGNLGEMYRYPFGIDLIQAYLSWVTGMDTLRIGHIFLSLVFALSGLTFYGILKSLFSDNANGNIIAMCCPFLILILYKYSINEYWVSYHSSQMFGTLIVLISILILSKIKSSKLMEVSLSIASITLLLTFPLWIAILNFLVLSYFILSKELKGNRIYSILYFIIPQIVVFIFYYIHGYVDSAVGISETNGGTTKISPYSFGGYILILLFVVGIIMFFKRNNMLKLNSIQMIFCLASAGIIIQFVSLKALIGIGFGSQYMVDKTFFLAKYFYIAFIAYSISEVLKYLKLSNRTTKAQYVIGLCLFVAAASLAFIFSKSGTTTYLINKGEYELSLESKSNEIRNNIILFPYPESPLTSYLIYVGLLEQDRFNNPMSRNYLQDLNIPNILGWINGSNPEEYALIGDTQRQLVEPDLLKYVTVVKSNGKSAIVKRTPNKIKFSKTNGIVNESFESVNSDWIKVQYDNDDFELDFDSNNYYDGNKSINVKGSSINGGISQKIKLENNTRYKITAWASGRNIRKEAGLGVFMSIEGSSENIVEWPQSEFDWQMKELIFDSENRSEINLILGLGAYGSASGEVWFDKIEIFKEATAQ